MKKKYWGAVLLVIILSLFFVNFASAQNPSSSEKDNSVTKVVSTMDELLLFWEEKDLYVQTATRTEKPISQTAENMTVITAKDIEDMNAHTVAEVLNRVSGLFVDFAGQDFGSPALIYIQGSLERHVLILVDGIPINLISSGAAETNFIPVTIIDRMEIIKGPASSVWGSGSGGVVNIITKNTGDSQKPKGAVSASYGNRNSQDYTAEAAGKVGDIGYYAALNYRGSDGLRDGRFFRDAGVYSKFNLPVAKDISLGLSMGYSEPHFNSGDLPSNDLTSQGLFRVFFVNTTLDAVLTSDLKLKIQFYLLNQKFVQHNDELGTGDLFLNAIYKEQTSGGSGKLIWNHGIHNAVFGLDISHGTLDQTNDAGPLPQSYGAPASETTHPSRDKWAVFANDTITLGKFSVTPGVRLDKYPDGSFFSPSLGMTYKLSDKTILRASTSRGFTLPALPWLSGGGLFLDPNPDLKPEKVWSYQAGIESSICDYLRLKATLFKHDMKDAIIKELYAGGPPAYNDLLLNRGRISRQGIEIEAETAPYHNLSLKSGFAYVDINPSEVANVTNYVFNLGIKYDDKKTFMTEAFGHYIWWDAPARLDAKYNSFIWDINIRKKICSCAKTDASVFLSVHNVFDGSQYSFGDAKNPGRWAEAGLKLRF